MKTILALDTTSRHASISIAGDEEIRLEYNFATRAELSASLVPSIEFVLNSVPLKLEDIDIFGIGVGPGLFTGIRVGLATLKGLLMGTGKPVVPVVTLDAIAFKYRESSKTVVSMIDARRNEVYVSAYGFSEMQPQQLLAPELVNIDQLEQHLAPLKSESPETGDPADARPLLFVGSGSEAHWSKLKTRFKGATINRRSCFLASEICKITYQRYSRQDFITDLQQLMPLYIRKSDAEQNYARTKDQS
jgi:tRNA threonylcarbamoyladenosine biosynthesis protein TsaB